jgi:predicted helicase
MNAQILDTMPSGQKFSFRVEKMKFVPNRKTLRVNDCITLAGFTLQMFEYKLGNRSALDWIVESYRVKTDARSGLTSDPNRKNKQKYILDLIGKVATVSLETQKLFAQLPPFQPAA